MIRLGYNIKYNGVFYPIGSEIPVESENALYGDAPTKEVKVEKKVEPVKVDTEIKPEAEPEKVEPIDKKYTKTEINRMSTKELRELANKVGINDNTYVGIELKEMLINKLVK